MELDRHKLEEERVWRLEHYQAQVKRMVSSLVDAIQLEAKRTLEREIVYDDDIRNGYNYVDQAGNLQHAILQAVNNADFGGLTRDAGELHAVEMGLHTLDKLKESLPSEIRELLVQNEDSKQQALLDEKLAEIEARESKQAERCRASVSQPGRGVGFYQCTKKGSKTYALDVRPGHSGKVAAEGDEGAEAVRVCGTHAKEIEERGYLHLYTPSDWEAGQNSMSQRREQAQLERFRSSLPLQLTEGEGE